MGFEKGFDHFKRNILFLHSEVMFINIKDTD